MSSRDDIYLVSRLIASQPLAVANTNPAIRLEVTFGEAAPETFPILWWREDEVSGRRAMALIDGMLVSDAEALTDFAETTARIVEEPPRFRVVRE